MTSVQSIFTGFTNRRQWLKAITRYSLYQTMYYRTNLWTHSLRVYWLAKELLPEITKAFGSRIDADKLQIMALIHDDLEIIMGDVQAAHKSKMNKREQATLKQTEYHAIDQVADRFPRRIGRFSYRVLLREAQEHRTLESQLVKYLDWLEAFNEALHEIHAGNVVFTKNVIDRRWGRLPVPTEYYIPRLTGFSKRFPRTAPLFSSKHPLLQKPMVARFQHVARQARPHTQSSLLKRTGYPIYDAWKSTMRKRATTVEYKKLYRRKE